MIIRLIVLYTFYTGLISAQGIRFAEGNWQEVINLAAKENKLIYLDVYTTWCGPCKMMEKKFFPDSSVGAFYNANFINYRLDAENGEGIKIAKQYKVQGYPTNLFIEPSSAAVLHTAVGAPREKVDFIQNAKDALDEQKDPLSSNDYINQFKTKKDDTNFINTFFTKLDRKQISYEQYLDELVGQKLPESFLGPLLNRYNKSINSKAFDWLMAHSHFISYNSFAKDQVSDYASSMAYKTISNLGESNKEKGLQAIKKYKSLYPNNKEEVLGFQQYYFEAIKDEDGKQKAQIAYADYILSMDKQLRAKRNLDEKEQFLKVIRAQLEMDALPQATLDSLMDLNIKARNGANNLVDNRDASKLNGIAWDLYENSKDKAMLKKALLYATKAIGLVAQEPFDEQAPILDTYACLLYKNGDKQKAIEVETSIIQKLENAKDAEGYQETLAKMKAGTL
jgi:thiol-disulfide isomerase/thioredoxin